MVEAVSRREAGHGVARGLGFHLGLLHRDMAGRYWEVDALRGLAIVMMVAFHAAFDVAYLGYWQTDVFAGAWKLWSALIASTFIGVAGVSLAISYSRLCRHSQGWRIFGRYLRQGLRLLGWGLVITFTSWLYTGEVVVAFGILHLIGTATILSYPFLARPRAGLAVGALAVALGMHFGSMPVIRPWAVLPLVGPPATTQLDYFPLLPWAGVMLIGVFLGQSLYPGGRRRLSLPEGQHWLGLRQLVWLGQRSLLIYLAHQPVLLALLTLVGYLGLIVPGP